MLESLMMICENEEQTKMCVIIKNSSHLLLYLVNDMLDAYMLKTGKFDPILSNFNIEEQMQEIYDMFYIQSQSKNVQILMKFDESVPDLIESDSRRFK